MMVTNSDIPSAQSSASRRYCILVVEDEFLIRLLVSDELRDAGYDAIEACNADEAVAVLESRIPVDLVFSDVRMPGSFDGLGLVAFIKATFPSLPVILMSGHLEPRIALMSGVTQFIAKPFSLGIVREAVRLALENDA